jgi:hypothetical protein
MVTHHSDPHVLGYCVLLTSTAIASRCTVRHCTHLPQSLEFSVEHWCEPRAAVSIAQLPNSVQTSHRFTGRIERMMPSFSNYATLFA